MMDDKCPTCPIYGTGQACNCAPESNPVGVGCFLLIAVAMICLTLIVIFG